MRAEEERGRVRGAVMLRWIRGGAEGSMMLAFLVEI